MFDKGQKQSSTLSCDSSYLSQNFVYFRNLCNIFSQLFQCKRIMISLLLFNSYNLGVLFCGEKSNSIAPDTISLKMSGLTPLIMMGKSICQICVKYCLSV